MVGQRQSQSASHTPLWKSQTQFGSPTIRLFLMRLHAGLPERSDGLPSPSLPEVFYTDGRGHPSSEMPQSSPHEASVSSRAIFFIRSPALPSVVRNPLTTDGKAGPRMKSNSPGTRWCMRIANHPLLPSS